MLQFIQPDDISHVRTVAHGTKTEPVAIKRYVEKNAGMSYFKGGFVIHPYALHLGASPDGVLYDKSTSTFGILNKKCPCSSKVRSLKEYTPLKTFCMEADENGILRLKHNHDYYHQVQGQMLLSG
ncbi:hypothetical protein JTB14_021102 [Gonioctena quinquepunctata]|nr:hypothetical protein JTB14_021102 [Gonioctena quinquepunctata]